MFALSQGRELLAQMAERSGPRANDANMTIPLTDTFLISEYDEFGNVTVVVDANGAETHSTYDASGNVLTKKVSVNGIDIF